MRGNLQGDTREAISGGDNVVRKSVSDGGKSVSDENWFADAAQQLLDKPGLELHLNTGLDERSCHRYAAGTVKPPAYFLRSILRSEHGGQFLAFLMQGADPAWWRDLKNARELCSKFRIEPL